MTVEDKIAELLAQAEPLRALPEDEAEEKGLPKLVDRINALRALPPDALAEPEAARRGPVRPKKADR